MFIDVTRYGGTRALRLAITAIAYLDACEGGTAMHLLGGETLRVSETPPEIEQLIEASYPQGILIEGAEISWPREMVAGDIMPAQESAMLEPNGTTAPAPKRRKAS